jgi:hypothetical protein
MMERDHDVARLRAEITNAEFAARSFRDAANMMQAQRDEARREVRALRRRIRLGTVALMITLTILLVAGSPAFGGDSDEAAVSARSPQSAVCLAFPLTARGFALAGPRPLRSACLHVDMWRSFSSFELK